jgi:nucleotide-binding universal stress UspA family protein
MTHPDADTVLVALDGTERSRDALALGQLIAEVRRARLLMAYVHPYGEVPNLLGHAPVVRAVVDSIFADSKAILPSGAAREVRILVHRSPATGLRRLAHEEGASLVVVGSSGGSRTGRVVSGRTAGRLLSDASLPVAIAPHGYAERERGIDLVGCAFDGRPESRTALRWVSSLARGKSSRLVVFTVRDSVRAGRGVGRKTPGDDDETLREQRERTVREALADVTSDSAVDIVWLGGDPRLALAQRSWALDLLALGATGRRGLRARLFGDAAGDLGRAANCALVLVPPDAHHLPFRRDAEHPDPLDISTGATHIPARVLS